MNITLAILALVVILWWLFTRELPVMFGALVSAGAVRRNWFNTIVVVGGEVLGKPRFDAFVLASGTNFADALSGSYLAAVKNAPILLGYKGEYNFQTILYIHANLEHGGTVYILGGEKAVSKEFDDAFQTLGIRYERLAGADRFETNLMVLREAGVKAGDEVVCFGSCGRDSITPDDWALLKGTHAYDIICSLGSRVQRVVK